MKVITRLAFLLAILLTATASAMAATREVKGKVTDTSGEPLIGVSVSVENAPTNGSLTDIDGNFSLKVPEGPVSLKVSYLGYDPVVVKVAANQSSVDVKLKENSIMLEETVVIGYGTQKKVNLTGAVASLDGKKLENRPATSVSNMLQGSVAGLNITTSSGIPGQSASINIRGKESINGAGPLVLIDGAIGDIDAVNPNDVESVSVIKDASAAAVYGARAAYGVILVTTKSGQSKDGKATVRYNGRVGWEEPTTSTDFITQGYWSVYTVNQFFKNDSGNLYLNYSDYDMQQLLLRVNDKTEHPDRPWIVDEVRNGKRQWYYYGNYDWYHQLYRDSRPVQQHNISFSGGKDKFKYFLSGGMDMREGFVNINPDKFKRFNLRSKIDFALNKWATVSNNTSFFGSTYTFQGNGSIEDTFAYSARHALACYPMKNPDGTWVYDVPYQSYKVANGRHAILGNGGHRNTNRKTDFSNTFRLNITPIKQLVITGDFTYRLFQTRNTHRTNNFSYRKTPDSDLGTYNSGAGLNELKENINTTNYYSVNAFATYTDTFNEAHNLTVMAGYNYEAMNLKKVGASGQNLTSPDLDDLDLVGPNEAGQTVVKTSGGQGEYKLQGIFGRVNYDYRGIYLAEVSGRYDGTSRFARGHRWGFFPSASLGWRLSEEKFFAPLRSVIDNTKIRVSYGSLGNQAVNDYYAMMRLVTTHNFESFSFGDTTVPGKYSSLQDAKASDLTWEKANQWDLGLDLNFFNNRLIFTGDLYIRDTKDMVTAGMQLPGVYGASSPKMNNADMRTKGYELALSWNDGFDLFGHRFNYNIGFNLSDYRSEITKFMDNADKLFNTYSKGNETINYYQGMRVGEIWGYSIDGLFASDEEAAEYQKNVDLTYMINGLPGGYKGGDVKYLDLNGDGKVNNGNDTMISLNGKFYVKGDPGYAEALKDPNHKKVPVNSYYNHGDKKLLGNSLPSLQYGITAGFQYFGFDASIFLQGTGNHYWYPNRYSMPFWGCYSYPYLSFIPTDFRDKIWSEDNPDAYFPRPVGYAASSYNLNGDVYMNDRYLQNLRYLRLKNLTVGYTVPQKWTKKIYLEKVRVYFTGENLTYWSPLKKNSKYIDPEGAFGRDEALNNAFYPWAKTFMFGLDIQF